MVFLLAGCGDKKVSDLIDEVDTDSIDTGVIDPTDQTDTADPTNPDPTNPDPTDPTNPDPTNPDPTDPTDPTNPVDPTETPDTEVPDTETPDSETPDTEVPDSETPDTEVPDTETPDSETPDTEVPDTETPDEDIPEVVIEFERITADDNPNKPAFVTVDDLDNDGHLDMIVAQYGPSLSGNYDIYWGTGDLANWTKETLNIGGDNGISFPHLVKVADVNGDGIKDIISPSGFLACLTKCGNIFWLEGTGERNKWTKHEIIKNNDHFFFDVSLVDIDGDGINDILTNASKKSTLGAQDERLMWLKGTTTADRFETTARVIADGNGGPFPRFVDINGDGKKDIAVAQFFNKNISTQGSFLWFEQKSTEEWEKHIIDSESGTSFMLEIIDNLYGDGVRRAVGVNHVNSADDTSGPKEGVFVFDIPSNPKDPWPKTNIATDIKSRKSPLMGNQAAPGLFGYGDITGNGLIDLVVSGDGDSRVFWFEQKPAGTFTQHTLDGVAGASVNSSGSFGQAGGMQIVDLDGDGKNEIIVTLYEDNKLYIYKVK